MIFFPDSGKGTVTGENGSSASGHAFTVDESSIYWTQQAHEDQRPQFKNDHQKPVAAADGISGRPPPMNSLQPPPPMPPPSSRPPVIYRTDDQLQDEDRREEDEDAATVDDDNGNRDDSGDGGDKRFESTTRQKEGTADLDVSGSAAVGEPNDFHDYDDGFKDLTTADHRYRQPTSDDYYHNRGDNGDNGGDNNWKAKQHRWTSEKRQDDQDDEDDEDASAAGYDDGDNGYQVLACPATNNFYTHFRW